MNTRIFFLPALLLLALLFSGCNQQETDLPNILWITSEDNSRFLGCYGDTFATTPNLDRLASEGFLYTNAYANTPVCAPARNTIITGVYACSNGNEQMRSRYSKSETVRYYTEYLMGKGYYCTNNSKTDYNTSSVDLNAMWDECGREAHYRNRDKDQPFFAIFNIGTSHESSIHTSIPNDQLRHSPDEVVLPPYHPDTPEMRHDWAQYYDKVEDMDTRVGEVLKELEEAGLAENTIVFYYSDHGGILGRSKRFLYETGTHVPFIIHIPEKYKHLYPSKTTGSIVDRLVSFVDLAPTLLSLIGQEAPEYMQGQAFLGKYQKDEPGYIYMFRDRMDGRYDMSRSIVDRNFRYTRNYNSSRIYLQHLAYLWRAPSMRSWEEAFKSGQCNEVQSRWWNSKPAEELYNTENDPWEVNNLADDPAYAEKLETMRKACLAMGASILDAGFIPEADRNIRAGSTPIYDYMRSDDVPYGEIMAAAVLASENDPDHLDTFIELLDHDDSAIRYWAAQGLLLLGEEVRPAIKVIERAAYDESWNVSVTGAEILYLLGETKSAIEAYNRVLQCDEPMARTHALNSIDHINGKPEEFMSDCVSIIRDKYEELNMGSDYDARVIQWLFKKWSIDPSDHGIEFP
ncbi:MAG: sulfatase-like hydrolase/transferase [Bacteroidales bacterium]|nr:sulfatase-like hydrolase/transferase [Bacteroidales bacterium]